MRKKVRRENKYEREAEILAISRKDRKRSVYIYVCVKKKYRETNERENEKIVIDRRDREIEHLYVKRGRETED